MVAPDRKTIKNHLLHAMAEASLDRLWPELDWVPLMLKDVLLAPDEPAHSAYFVDTGLVSMIATLDSGELTEVGVVGTEGMVGLSALLGGAFSPLEALVQVEGGAFRISAAALTRIAGESPEVMGVLLHYVNGFLIQVPQTAACNTHHIIERRLARWILMTHDRVPGDRFTMTQQFLSHMLGVQRPGVTLAMRKLQDGRLVRHAGGQIDVLDRAGLEQAACSCYELMKRRTRAR